MMKYHECGHKKQPKKKKIQKLNQIWLIMGNKAVSYNKGKLIMVPY